MARRLCVFSCFCCLYNTDLQKCGRFQGVHLGKIYNCRIDVNASKCLQLMKLTSMEFGFCFKICKFWRVDFQVQRSTHSPGHNDRYHLAYFWHSLAPSPFSAAHLQTMIVQSYLTSHRHDICFLNITKEICDSIITWKVTWADMVGVEVLLTCGIHCSLCSSVWFEQ